MATYREIQKWMKKNYGYSIKTCWIAHAKEKCGLNPRRSPNRHDQQIRTNPCPDNKFESIRQAFIFFRMI